MQPVATGTDEIFQGLSIIHSNHMEDLKELAVQWIRTHPLRPLENELFLVQSNGMAKWLQLSLAENNGCGIAACLDMMLPGRFMWDVYAAVLPKDQIPDRSPYDRSTLLWRLFHIIPKLLDDPDFISLKNFLRDNSSPVKLYQLCDQVSGLFDQYQVYRADWLEDWGSGNDVIRNGSGKKIGMPEDQLWQPRLWRQVQDSLPEESRETSRASLHRLFLDEIKTPRRPSNLPRRVIVFGISSLPQQTLELLHSISAHCQVIMFVHNPCRHYWADIIEDRELLKIENARHCAKGETADGMDRQTMHQHVNPLLAAWGKQGRDYIGLLYGYDRPDSYRENFTEIDLFDDFIKDDEKPSLLCQVQQAILDLTPLPASDEKKLSLPGDDRSISFHLAHSCQREVEILQDQLLSFFEENPDLKPRDIIVMAPDIEKYAAPVEAVFGRITKEDKRYIPFTIADRTERASNPMLVAFEKLLTLPDSRMGVSDISGLLEVEPFRERFGIAQTDLPQLHAWIDGAGVRWGLNSDHRKSLGLPPDLEQNTWFFGLKRMLLGYAIGKGDPWKEIEPYDEVGGLEASLAGALFTILETLEKYRKLFETPAVADDWCKRVTGLLHDCFMISENRDRLMFKKIEDTLFEWHETCETAGLESDLTLEVVRDYLSNEISDSTLSRRFLAGRVNFCSLMPMRAIPFKVVALLGMNDGDYPRRHPPFDFDLMAQRGQYRPGDRSRRDDDRYLFLEALLSAREKLYISYQGKSQKDNSHRTPSVLVGQLRDYLDAGWRFENNHGLARGLTVQYPLQPFSMKYFTKDSGFFTYSKEWRKMFYPSQELEDTESLDPMEFDSRLSLSDLIRFLKNPVQNFYNRRLGVYFNHMETGCEDLEPFAMDQLAPFVLGQQLLDAGLSSPPDRVDLSVDGAAKRLLGTGELPMGGFGKIAADDLASPVKRMIEEQYDLIDIWPEELKPREIRFPVEGSGQALVEDWLDKLYTLDKNEHGPLARWEFYPLSVKDVKKKTIRPAAGFFSIWVKHLSGCAMGMELTSYLITPDGRYGLDPVGENIAADHLNEIIARFQEGMCCPLPVTAKTSFAYEEKLMVRGGTDDEVLLHGKAVEAARAVYEGDGFNANGEVGYNPCLSRRYPDFNALFEDPECFARLSGNLYRPMIEAIWKGSE